MAVIVDSDLTDAVGQVEDGVYHGALPSLDVPNSRSSQNMRRVAMLSGSSRRASNAGKMNEVLLQFCSGGFASTYGNTGVQSFSRLFLCDRLKLRSG